MLRHLLPIFVFSCAALCGVQAQDEPYRNPNLSPDERARDLLSRMTLDEKLSQMMNVSEGVPRLGIPPYDWWNEALHGVARSGLATVFPQAIGLAATFDERAVEATFTMVSDEARAKHAAALERNDRARYTGLTFWTPNVNLFRDPRWGRGQETYGEDPWLTSRMGLAVVRGLQGDGTLRYDKTHACAKHYAVHSGPEWSRHRFDVESLSPRDLYESYLPAFRTLVREGQVREVMCAYNRFEGEPCCSNKQLLVRILREEWGFDGVVVSDCGAIGDFYGPKQTHHATHATAEAASADAVLSGTDLECGGFYAALKRAIDEGLVCECKIDESVFRLLRARFQLGMFDDPELVPWTAIPYEVVDSKRHRAQALEMARKSIVLLTNHRSILPLDRRLHKIAVVGPNADDSVMMWGNYNGTPSHTATILEGIRRKLPDAEVAYARGCDHAGGGVDSAAVAACTADADVIIFAGGLTPRLEGEEMPVDLPGFRGGDRTAIELPAVQTELLRMLKRTGRPVIFVLCSGSAVALREESALADALLAAWYPGQAGGTAVADVLFGDYNPAGRLPVTFYASTADLPDYEDYAMAGRTYRYFRGRPLFPFGYGLSYSSFSYGRAVPSARRLACGEGMTLTVPVTNRSRMSGDEVVQVYVRRMDDPDGPLRSLRAFRRVTIPAGETRRVEIALPAEAFEAFDPASERMTVRPGRFELFYGGSSMADRRLEVTLK